MITRNEIPLLEYDDSSLEVIAPDHDYEKALLLGLDILREFD